MKETKSKNINRKLLGPWQRIGSILLEFVMVFFVGLLLDRIAVNPIAKATTNLNVLAETYNSEVKEYQDKEDVYHLYYYDEDKNRIKNDNVADEELNAFMSDERVIAIRNDLPGIQDTIQAIRLTCLGVDAFLGSLLYFTFAYILFGKGRSLGLIIFKSHLTDENGNKISIGKAILYGFLKWLILVPGGIVTIFILPIYTLYELFYKDNVTFLERKMHIECRVQIKDI